jgi:serine/threonine-protein kinase RsbT
MSTSGVPSRAVLSLACGAPGDSAWCAAAARRYALGSGLSEREAQHVALAVSELVSNVQRHGGGRGIVTLRHLEYPRRGVEVEVRDAGPGIADPALALADGWSRGAQRTADSPRDGLGAGLGTVRRAMDEVVIDSPSEGGARVTARKFAAGRP